MSQSLTQLYIHLVFSTKERLPLIHPSIKNELYAYMGGTLKSLESPSLNIGGMPDHVHILYRQSKNVATAKIVEEVKKSSSKWIKSKGQEYLGFQWQGGYAAFSVSQSGLRSVKSYINNQEIHHQKFDFQEELKSLLVKYEVDFDEQYLWS